jgi:hypothetical protein
VIYEIVMKQQEEGRFIRLQQDGTLVIELRGSERVVQIAGVVVPRPLPEAYLAVFRRLAHRGKPIRCEVQSEQPGTGIRAKIFYYGWQDKTGDVWQDLAILLLEEGAVEVAEEDFPEKETYRQHARRGKR